MVHKTLQKDHMNAGKKYYVDEEQIRVYWKFIVREGRNHKFHVFKKDGSVSKEIDVDNVEELIALCKKHNLEGLTCLSVNPFKKGKTKVGGVTEIIGILIDIDVKKDRKVNGVSTPEDKAIAKKTTENVIKKLEEKINLRISLFVDSGNGYHIYIPIYINLEGFFTDTMPKNHQENCTKCGKLMELEESIFICKKCKTKKTVEKVIEEINKELWDNSDIRGRLVSLEKQLDEFNSDVVEIDCISKDIVRRVKIPGTWNVKKEISKKDYRMAKIIETFEDAIDLFVDSNTNVFSSFEPYKEPEEPTRTEGTSADFAKLLKRDRKLFDLFTGDWNKEPYSLKTDGTPKKKWTRSEAEFMLICRLVWYDLSKEVIFSIMDGCKIGKWDTTPKGYRNHQYNSAKRYVNGHGGTRTTCRQVSILNNGNLIATLYIRGRNAFEIKDKDRIIFPMTQVRGTPWYGSVWYRKQICKKIGSVFDIRDSEVEKIIDTICSEMPTKIKQLNDSGAFKPSASDDEMTILDNIEYVDCTRSDDGNIYNIYLNGETIQVKDTDLLGSPASFNLQYMNRFFQKRIISDEIWNEYFVPLILDKGSGHTKEKLSSQADTVLEKFMLYLRSSKIFNWDDLEKRKAYLGSIYYDTKKQEIRISCPFMQAFFEKKKIELMHKIGTISFAAYLRGKQFLASERKSGKIGKRVETWWCFFPEKLGVTEDDIIKPKEKNALPSEKIEDFGRKHEK